MIDPIARRSLHYGILTVSLLSLGACATVLRGRDADWSVSSIPAGAEVTTSNGGHCEMTPCTLSVERKTSFSATLSMPGYQPQTIQVDPKVKFAGGAAFLGNALIGGALGAVVDVWTGAPLDPSPNGTVLTLASDPSIMRGASADEASGCSREKFLYALRVGVPCSSLSAKVDLRTLGQLAER